MFRNTTLTATGQDLGMFSSHNVVQVPSPHKYQTGRVDYDPAEDSYLFPRKPEGDWRLVSTLSQYK